MTGERDIEIGIRRKRLKFRSWHRGMREIDLILGSFADRHVGDFDPDQLSQFERILELEDPLLYAWISGKQTPPAGQNSAVMKMLLNFKYNV